ERPSTWRLIYEGNGLANPEEIMMRVQGIISLKDLPPLTNKPRSVQLWTNIHLRQAVSLTGLGTEKFEQSIDAIIHIHTIFSRTFKDGLLDPWLLSAFKDHNAIDISNRYFTSHRQSPNTVQLPFHKLVDPDRILEGMVDRDIVHSEENDVQYFELNTKNGDTREQYIRTDPTKFRIGDHVEVQMSFVGVPLKGGKVQMMAVLRALTLLDCRHSMVGIIWNIRRMTTLTQ
ncbi:hypothetical protein PILCRDRAFT_68465, partial [Piloderma croceum F 1598]